MPQKIKNNNLLLLLGGSGQRFQSRIPKQFQNLPDDEFPLFIRTILELVRHIDFARIILVVNPDFLIRPEFLEPLNQYKTLYPNILIEIIEGGKTRHESFLNGARYVLSLDDSGYLAVQDANRPYISETFGTEIRKTLEKLSAETPCFIPVLPSTDSLCTIDKEQVTDYIPRDKIMTIQTPQLLFIPSLREALQKLQKESLQKNFTDEGSFMIQMGYPVFTYPGDPANKKITFMGDMS